MIRKRLVLALLLGMAHGTYAEEFVLRGLSVYAGADERNFPVIVRNKLDPDGRPIGRYGKITIQFDVLGSEPPDLRIHFFHCNRDWKVDNNSFVADRNFTQSFTLRFATSPGGVEGYSYRYVNSFPDDDDVVRFDYSGNWLFTVISKDEKIEYARGRFFVVDDISPTTVTVQNVYLTSAVSPHNQVHRITARVKLPREIDGYYYTTADVYQNFRIYNPYRIDMWDKDPYTFVEGQNTGFRIFSIANIMPGNEYRTFDLSNTTRYPNNAVARQRDGVDQTRLYWRTGEDRNGTASTAPFSGIHSDYLEVMFRLDLTASEQKGYASGGREVYVAGAFNFWHPASADRLVWNERERAYVVTKFLRRGIYDYQYITARPDPAGGVMIDQDWTAIEGNDWRTINTYRVFVYFNDSRFGGFDRIVGYGVAESNPLLPGSN